MFGRELKQDHCKTEWGGGNLKEGALPTGWKLEVLGKLSSAIQYGYTAKAQPEPVGPRMLRITDIQNDMVKWDEVPFCKIRKEEKQKYLLCFERYSVCKDGRYRWEELSHS